MQNDTPINTMSSIEAEQSILGALLLKNDIIDDLDDLSDSHFTLPEHKIMFRATKKLILDKKNHGCDPIILFEALTRTRQIEQVGGMVYINALVTSVGSAVHARRYADIVIDKAKLRAVHNASLAINEACAKDRLTGEQALAVASEALALLDESDNSADSVSAIDIAGELLSDIGRRAEGLSAEVIPTGFSCLDNDVVDGGFERGQLVVIGGRTSMGKTAFGFNLLTNMTDDYVGLVVSLEMSKLQLARRCVASLGGVSLSDMKNGVSSLNDDGWAAVSKGTEALGAKKFHIQERTDPTAHNICSAARKHKRKHGLDVLMIDHLGLMNHGNSKSNDAAKIGESTRILKSLAQELNIVVLLLVQINRSGASATNDTKRPNKAQLRDSGRIEEDADIILLLHRDDYYRDEEKKTRDGHTHLLCEKVRDGDPKTVNLKFDGAFSRFTDWHGAPPHLIEEYKPKSSNRSYS